jgi:putative ABC transport system permease protein
MSSLSQTFAATGVAFRSIPLRLGNSIVIVIGIAAVVAVLVSVLAMAAGFDRTVTGGARADRVLILRTNADEESASALSREDVATIQAADGLLRYPSGDIALSAEVVMVAPVARKNSGADAYITLRGVGPQAMRVRPELELIEGRMFETGVQEMIVGRAARAQFADLGVGSRIRLNSNDWTIVGVFAGGETVRESEALADAQSVMSSYKLDAFNSATALLTDASALAPLRAALGAHPRLEIKVLAEPEYVANVTASMQRLLRAIAFTIGGLMAFGALFGALNTMYSSVAARSSEIATFRALGFGADAMVVSILIEALALALLGAAIGIVIAYAAFDGQSISTLGGSRWDSQLVYSLTITPALAALATALACGIGLIGGLIPAVRAIRAPVAQALQAV